MTIRYVQESTDVLSDYGNVSIAFTVRSKFLVEATDRGLGGWLLTEVPVDPPYVKDYDAQEGPTRWLRWDTSNWRVISAFDENKRVGGAVVAWNTPGAYSLEGRDDIAALWDIRVQPGWRGQGIGKRLFDEVVAYARSRNCKRLKIETQNNNVVACRFYASQGCELRGIHPNAYPDLPEEVEFNWYLDL